MSEGLVELDRDQSGANDLLNAVGLERFDEPLNFGEVSRELDNNRGGRRRRSLTEELEHQFVEALALIGLGLASHKHHLSVDRLLRFERFALDDVDQLVQLSKDLNHDAMIAFDHKRHSAEALLLTVSRIEGGKAEASSSEKRHHSIDGARFVLNESGDGVALIHLAASTGVLSAGSMITWLLLPPAGTIGKTFSSISTTNSHKTGPL